MREALLQCKLAFMGSNDISELLKLKRSERLAIAEKLWASVAEETEQSPASAADIQFIDARLDAHLESPESAVPWSQIKKELGI